MANTPLQPMTVGNVVSAGLRLYGDRFSTYFPIGVRASLWALIPVLVILPIPFLIFFQQVNLSILWIAIPIWLILLIFTSAKSITNLALISRLAFGILSNKPETVKEASAQVMPKMWKFWMASFLAFLLLLAITAGFYLVIFVFGFLAIGFLGFQQASPVVYVILGLFVFVLFAAFLIFYIRFAIGLSLIEVPLAIEHNLTAWATIQRSLKLTKGYAGKIFAIFIVAGLIFLPLQLLASLLSQLVQNLMIEVLVISPESPIFQVIVLLLALIIGIGLGVFIVPFYQTIKATIYYDLRTRKEGLDIKLSNE
jgi:hypothetical protein